MSVVGLESTSPCPTSLVALHGSLWEWIAGLLPPMATGLENDSTLPTSLNTSWLCNVWDHEPQGPGWNPPTCPESSTLNVSFGRATGTVNTCSSLAPETMTLKGSAVAVRIPFSWSGREWSVPAVVSMNSGQFSTWAFPGLTSFGTSLTFQYAFPVGGIWSYESVAAGNSAGSGLVFSYSPCPA